LVIGYKSEHSWEQADVWKCGYESRKWRSMVEKASTYELWKFIMKGYGKGTKSKVGDDKCFGNSTKRISTFDFHNCE
jgi:hypothetical protein